MSRCKFRKERNEDMYTVTNKKNEELGVIWFHHSWKKWTWEQNYGIVMSKGCLKEIVEKIEKLGSVKNV